MIANRLKKNLKKRKPWLNENIEAFRLYDRDIPEYPFIVEVFQNHAVVWKKTDEAIDKGKEHHFTELLEAIEEVLAIEKSHIHIKERARQTGLEQYEKLGRKGISFPIKEFKAQYLVNLEDYLDTGLFLDHRPLRKEIQKLNGKLGKTMLNLFCYTASVSVSAALAGYKTTSIDMSKTYLEWGKKNFDLNNLNSNEHLFLREDVLAWLRDEKRKEKFDLIFFDPPTFSNSKKMEETFEVEKDHVWMIEACMAILKVDGLLYFSNNKRKFKMSYTLISRYNVVDISEKSIPPDFHYQKIHHLFKLRHKI